MSVSLYDAVMVALHRRAGKVPSYISRRDEIKIQVNQLSAGAEGLMTGRANTAASIKDRVKAVIEILDQLVP